MVRDQSEIFKRLQERYQSGDLPWDDPLPPPEVIDFASTKSPGRALDLGCGYGRATIFLASLGWDVDGVDFIPDAICEAAKRAQQAAVTARFHIASITDLDFLKGPYDFALDVGCCHNLDNEDLIVYKNHLSRLIQPGGFFLIFARIISPDDSSDAERPGGLSLETMQEIFSPPFKLVWQSLGETVINDEVSWSSGWFRFQLTG